MDTKLFDDEPRAYDLTAQVIRIQDAVLQGRPVSRFELPKPTTEQVERAKWIYAGLRAFLRYVEEAHPLVLSPREFEVTARFVGSAQSTSGLLGQAGYLVRSNRRAFLMGAKRPVEEDARLSDAHCLLGVLEMLCLVFPDQVRPEDIRTNYDWLIAQL